MIDDHDYKHTCGQMSEGHACPDPGSFCHALDSNMLLCGKTRPEHLN